MDLWMLGILRLQGSLLRVPEPMGESCTEYRWKCFKNCLGALDGTYIKVRWEGSASDSQVLRDAIARPNGLKVPTSYYYLVDGGYINGEEFLAPYRGTRCHISKWRDGYTVANHQEYFNMRHSQAIN
ncbi:hypothetical protein L3X38_036603 [Prunus dulcis]|uniref:DDE Tnp4 domain-containing protein n=1 Tax=Prunus dulcis TaxID=3755 RepID=A0AAD4YPK7_PRUDU|nr:hypothetical protein L3X38_036603 [Prunus dulcis]